MYEILESVNPQVLQSSCLVKTAEVYNRYTGNGKENKSTPKNWRTKKKKKIN